MANFSKRNLSFRYPESNTLALSNINLSVKAGETLAIVGYNGSGTSVTLIAAFSPGQPTVRPAGKTTLVNVLLRIYDFEGGSLRVNGVDVRRLDPRDFHAHVSAVFQGFSKFSASVKSNVGIGFVPEMNNADAIDAALELAGAGDLVRSLPDGVRTRLDGDELGRSCNVFCGDSAASHKLHGLSGGEVGFGFSRERRARHL